MMPDGSMMAGQCYSWQGWYCVCQWACPNRQFRIITWRAVVSLGSVQYTACRHLLSFVAGVAAPVPWYLALPHVMGTYLCLIMCLICRFIVITNSMMKYINRIGQKTGTSKTPKKVIKSDIQQALVQLYQNLNSGSLRANGRNSSVLFVGRSKSASDSSGSNCGEIKPINWFSK